MQTMTDEDLQQVAQQFGELGERLANVFEAWASKALPAIANLYETYLRHARAAYEAAGSPYGDGAQDENVVRWMRQVAILRAASERQYHEALRTWSVQDFRYYLATGRHMAPPPPPEKVV